MLGASGITNSRQTAGISLNHKRGALALYGGYTLAGCQTRVPDEAQIDYLAGPNADATAIHLLTSATPTRQLVHNAKASLDRQLGPCTSANLYPRGLRTDRTSTTDAATRRLHFPPGPDSTLTSYTDDVYYSVQYYGRPRPEVNPRLGQYQYPDGRPGLLALPVGGR